MRYIKEKSLDIRITQSQDGKYGCDIVCSHSAELICGYEPEFDTVKEVLAIAVTSLEVGLCSRSEY